MNEELNKLEIYKDKTCIICGKKYPDVILNVEGYIHHGGKLICVDTKKCNKSKNKSKKKK